MKKFLLIVTCSVLFFQLSCKEDITDHPVANQRPTTYLWLYPDSGLGTGVSRQHLRWWGEDPDGVVSGFLFAFAIYTNQVTAIPNPDTLHYAWVTANDTTILFPLDTLFRKFTVFVRSVDNTFRGSPSGNFFRESDSSKRIIRFTPTPFWDKNDNGVFDGGDEQLIDLQSAIDLRGAVQTFPVRNTPPHLTFANNPNDPGVIMKQPDTTFTAATFSWRGTDDDGNNTLVSYRIALNDTSNPSRWLTIPLRDTIVTIVVRREVSDPVPPGGVVSADVYGGKFLGRRLLGSIPGLRLDALNTLYAQVRDVAGEYSRDSTKDTWYVRKPKGKLLMVNDDVSYGIGADTVYRHALAAVPGGEFVTVNNLNIALGLTANDKLAYRFGRLMPPFIDPALIYTFLLYDYVFWYTEQYPTLAPAQLSLFPYTQNGGKLIFSTTFLNTSDPRSALRDFAPIDSVSSVDLTGQPPPPRLGDTRLPGNLRLVPDSSNLSNIYPALAFSPPATANYTVYMRPIYRRADARYIYHLEADPRNPVRYSGRPNIAVVDGQRTNIFVGLPLHFLNNKDQQYGNPNGLTAFFTKTLTQEFNPAHRIDRRKF